MRIFHSLDFSARRMLFACGGLLLATALCLLPMRQVQAQPGAGAARMLIVGDSISAEYGLARGQGWVALLAERLRQQGHAIEVINASISGETTAGGRSRLPALLKAHQPAYIIIELGGNDALRGLPLTSTRENLEAMVEAAQAASAHVLLLGMQVPPNYGAQYSRDFAQVFEDVAQLPGVALVPFMLEAIADPADLQRYFQPDRIHPNASAQPLILETVWPAIEAMLQ
ncbi:arylesterase [Lampropedia cohaerens]